MTKKVTLGSGFVVDPAEEPTHIESLNKGIGFLEECLDKGSKGIDELYAWYANNSLEIRRVADKLKDLAEIS